MASLVRLAFCVGAVVFLARGALLLAMDRFAIGTASDLALARLATAAPREAVAALLAGAATALFFGLTSGRGKWLVLLAALGSAALTTLFLVGLAHADLSRVVGWETGRGQVVTLALGAGALTLAAIAAMGHARDACSPRLAALATGVLVVTPVTLRLAPRGTDPEMRTDQVVAELFDSEAWTIVREHPRHPVRTRLMSPSTDWRSAGGGERPALEMVPPCEVRIDIPAGLGECSLRFDAGIDEEVWHRFGRVVEQHPEFEMRFEAELDGETIFDEVLTLEHDDRRVGSDWVPLRSDVRVRGGETLVLRTHVPEDAGDWARKVWPINAGFGDVRLVRSRRMKRATASPERPNIVFVVMDTLRADRTSAYGYERETTPHLDRLAERGVLFEQARSAGSYTWPATGSLLTGLLPEQHGVVDGDSCYLARELETLAEALQNEGYTTAAFTGNPLVVPGKGFGQGFEFFDHAPSFRKSPEFVPAALEWLEFFSDRRFFAYFQLVEPHGPLKPGREAVERFAADVPSDVPSTVMKDYRLALLRGEGRDEAGELDLQAVIDDETRGWIEQQYAASVYEGDLWLGRIIEALEKLGLLENTIVVFTSDHGEEIFDHGHAGHGQSVFSELIDVPLAIAGPGVPSGERISSPVSTRHLAATLAQLGGAALGDPGGDLLALAHEAPAALPNVYSSTRNGWWKGWDRTPLYAVRSGPLVLHWAPEAGEWQGEEPAPGQVLLFDVEADPGESRDLTQERPEEAEELRRWLESRVEELESRRVSPGLGAGSSTRDLLRRIGYVDD